MEEKMKLYKVQATVLSIATACLSLATTSAYAIGGSSGTLTAPVTGFARDFKTINPISDAKITILENGEQITTDKNGHFGPIQWPIGKPLTMVIEKPGYRTTQSATVIVPPGGLTTPYNNITLQPIDLLTFYLFEFAMGKTLNEEDCHVATTITAYHKILGDLPQGESHSIAQLSPATNETPHYFGVFTSGPMKDYPNPFVRGLTETSVDGGLVYANLEPRDTPYTISAFKPNISFTQAQFICRKGMFINLSPPTGPSAISG
jgi:hypothetical protein